MGDVLASTLPYFDVCVANMPYQVRAEIFSCWVLTESDLLAICVQNLAPSPVLSLRRPHVSARVRATTWYACVCVCVCVCVDSLMGFLNILVKNNYSGKIW